MQVSQGGSTLTQQLVRTTLITKEKQLRRKLREVFLALSLENELSKQEIFTLFVNTQFLGQRSYGFAAAAETYFGKSLTDVDASEAALLAGILQAPSRQNPVASVEEATERRTYVLRRMRELGYIDEAAWQAAMDKPVARGLHGPRVQIEAPYIGEMVRISLYEKFGDGSIPRDSRSSRRWTAACSGPPTSRSGARCSNTTGAMAGAVPVGRVDVGKEER